MSLDKLLEPRAPEPPKLCKAGKILESLQEPYRSALQNMFDVPYVEGGFSDEEITTRMAEAGIPAGHTIINRHRRGRCTCESVVNE